jgi:conjugal transfer pilin signal peptidase TrbI
MVKRQTPRYFLLGILAFAGVLLIGSRFFILSIAVTDSLPHHFYLIWKGTMPGRGDLVAYRWHGGGGYPDGTMMIKRLAGVPGDVIQRDDRNFYVHGNWVGLAKMVSRTGVPLQPAATGTLGNDEYYVWASHPDSLDSRYAMVGRLHREAFIGRAYAIF